jgi:hypothetical protein
VVVPDKVRFEGGTRESAWKSHRRNSAGFYDLCTNQHFTRRMNPLAFDYLRDFIRDYNPENRYRR